MKSFGLYPGPELALLSHRVDQTPEVLKSLTLFKFFPDSIAHSGRVAISMKLRVLKGKLKVH